MAVKGNKLQRWNESGKLQVQVQSKSGTLQVEVKSKSKPDNMYVFRILKCIISDANPITATQILQPELIRTCIINVVAVGMCEYS
jgi:hypothetical protein